jgi:hypothetical protein
MYDSRINEKLKDLTEDIEKDWYNLKMTVIEAAKECLGYQYRRKTNRLKKWYEEVRDAIQAKKTAYNKFLYTRRLEDHILYKKKPE